jgi:preprotein translocase subunit SecE
VDSHLLKNKEGLPAASTTQVPKLASFEELKAEFWRISWTDAVELKVCTRVVVLSIFLFAMAIYLADLSVQSGLWVVSWVLRLIFG